MRIVFAIEDVRDARYDGGTLNHYAQIDAFFAQLESLYLVVNAFAVSFSAAASWLALYFDTPAQ